MRHKKKWVILLFFVFAPICLEASTVTLRKNEADIREVFQEIAKVTGLSLLLDKSVMGTVSVDFRNIQWQEALSVTAKAAYLGFKIIKHIEKTAVILPAWRFTYGLNYSYNRTFHLKFAKVGRARAILLAKLEKDFFVPEYPSYKPYEITSNHRDRTVTMWAEYSGPEFEAEIAALIRELDRDPSVKGVKGKITLEADCVVLKPLLNQLASKAGYTLCLGRNVGGCISVSLRNLTFEKALQRVVERNDLYIEKVSGIHRGIKIIPLREASIEKDIVGLHRYFLTNVSAKTVLPVLRKKLKEWSRITSFSAAASAVLTVDSDGKAVKVALSGRQVKNVYRMIQALLRWMDRPGIIFD